MTMKVNPIGLSNAGSAGQTNSFGNADAQQMLTLAQLKLTEAQTKYNEAKGTDKEQLAQNMLLQAERMLQIAEMKANQGS